jgi:hypothetical protein
MKKKFLGLLKYVGFIKDEKVNIHRFFSGLPSFYKDKIQYDEPRTLIETIRKNKYMYEKDKGKLFLHKSWRDKKEKYDHRRNGFKPPFNRKYPNKNQQDQYAKNKSKREDSLGKRGRTPIKCWVCKENNMYKDYTNEEEKMNTMNKIQEATTIEDMGRSIPKIYAALEDPQVEHQSHMIEVEGNIINHPFVILIDSRETLLH